MHAQGCYNLRLKWVLAPTERFSIRQNYGRFQSARSMEAGYGVWSGYPISTSRNHAASSHSYYVVTAIGDIKNRFTDRQNRSQKQARYGYDYP